MLLAIDLIFLFILILYFFIGWNKGVVYALIDTVGVIMAYMATAYFSKSLASPLASYFLIPKIQGWIIAALLIFFSIIISITALKTIINKSLKRHQENEENFHINTSSKIMGSLITATLGLFVLSIIVTAYEALSGLSQKDNLNLSQSKSARIASVVFSNIVAISTDPTEHQDFIQPFLNNPRITTKRAKGVLENLAFRKVITSQGIINQTIAGDRFALVNNKLLLAAIADQDLKLRLEYLKVIKPALSDIEYRDLIINQLVAFGEKLKKSGNDKQLRFEINELIKSGDLRKGNMPFLYKNKNFQNILDILFF